jgi:hypothetical protein
MKKNTSNIFSLGRIFVNYFLIFIAIAFAGVAIYFFFLFTTANSAEAAETISPPNYEGAVIAILASAVIMVILFFWLKHYVEKRVKKDNVAKLRLFNRVLFDKFNNLLKKDGLMEEAYKHSPATSNALMNDLFHHTLDHAREIIEKEHLDDSLVAFESVAKYILSKDSDASASVVANCEKDGFRIVTLLIGSNLAKMEFEKLEDSLGGMIFHSLYYQVFHKGKFLNEIIEELYRILNEISLSRCQFERVREFLLCQEETSYSSPGLIEDITDLSKLLFISAQK